MSNWYLLLAILFVLVNGFFVAAEFALIKVRPTQLAELSAAGSFRARIVRRLMRRLDATLSATQLGITLTSLALGWVGEPAFASFLLPVFSSFGGYAATIAHTVASTCAFIIISILHIVLGELSPKSLAIQKSVGTALWTAVPLYGFYLVMFPAIWLLNNIARASMKVLRIRPASETEVSHSEEELRLIIASSEESGAISEPRREILEGVFEFSRRTARQIMVPRTDVVILSSKNSIQENLEVIRTTRHTRYPLCDGNLDQTIGLIHVKDLFLAQLQGPGKRMSDLKREVLFVPENTTVEGLLSQ
ncbi:MAG: hemolysin family protein, partial [Acidobacteriota bacterium]